MSNEFQVLMPEVNGQEKLVGWLPEYQYFSEESWFFKNSNSVRTQLNVKPKPATATVQSLFNRVCKEPGKLFDSHVSGESEFAKILNSSDKKSFLDVSIILKHFKLWNDEDFLEEYKLSAMVKFGNFSTSQEPDKTQVNVENFFSFLTYDWFDPEPGQTYAMVTKYSQFSKVHGTNIFHVLFDVIGNQRYKIYRHVVLRLLYQYLYELGKESCLKGDKCFTEIEELVLLLSEVKDQELKLRGIKVVAVFWLISCPDETKLATFEEFTEKILTSKHSERKIISELLDVSEETSHFFMMCFHLKKAKTSKSSKEQFEKEFELYLNNSKRNFGDYTKTAIGHNVQLLSFLALKEGQYSTVNYIADNFTYEKGSSILSVFDLNNVMTGFKVYEFKSTRLESLFQELLKSSANEKLKSFIKDPEQIEATISEEELTRFLFWRNLNTELAVQDNSLFEKILSTPGSGDLIKLIWGETNASTRSVLSGMNNCNRKYLLEYAIDSGDHRNLLEFLYPKIDENALAVPKVNLQFLNRQYANITGKSLIWRFVEICKAKLPKKGFIQNRIFENKKEKNVLCTDFYKIVLCLLEDGQRIQDIKDNIPIDGLLKLSSDPNAPSKLNLNGMQELNKVNVDEFKYIREEIDILLGNIVAFWSKDDLNYAEYSKKLLEESQFKSFFAILLSIIDEDGKNDGINKFRDTFVENFDQFKNEFVLRYERGSADKRPRRYFLGLIVLAAILNDRKDIIEFILKSEAIRYVKLIFPPNMRRNKTTNYFARKMLENGYEMGRNKIPLLWITSKQFKEFLDARMEYVKTDVIKVDCRFLTHIHNRMHPAEGKETVKWEDTKCLEFMLGNHSMKEFIEHPTIATYIDLKMHGFRGIYWGNFWFFALLIALPFGLLVATYFSENEQNAVGTISWMCAFSITILISRELFQFRVVEDSFRSYIKRRSNMLEICLILVATGTLAGILVTILLGNKMEDHLTSYFRSYVMLTKFLSVTLMLLFTLDLLATLQNAAMPFYFILLRRVAATFIKFLGTFMVFLVAFTISFMVFFGVDDGINENVDEVFSNFDQFPKAFTKIILMLSGEYSIEPFTLTAPELILFFVFVISTFILFNLILALTIDDVQKIKKEARRVILLQNAESIIGTSSFSLKILDKSLAFEQRHAKSSWYVRYFIQMMVTRAEARATKYLLHKGDNLYINIRNREVTYSIGGNQQIATGSRIKKIGNFISRIFVNHTFVMERENFEEIKNLVKPINMHHT